MLVRFAEVISAEMSDKSVSTTISLNSDACSSFDTTQENVDSFVESKSSLTTTQNPQTYVIELLCSFTKDPDVDRNVSAGCDVSEANEEGVRKVGASSERYIHQDKDEEVFAIPDGVQKDHSNGEDGSTVDGDRKCIDADREIGTALIAGKKSEGKDAEINMSTILDGAEKDLGKEKDFKAVLTSVENDQDMDEEKCTVFGGVERDHEEDKDVSTVPAGVEEDLGKHEETANRDEQTAEPDYALLEPSGEFRVCLSFVCLGCYSTFYRFFTTCNFKFFWYSSSASALGQFRRMNLRTFTEFGSFRGGLRKSG